MKNRTANALAGTCYNVENAPAICALIDFAAQNPGLDFGNYGNHAAYGAESRSISQDWRRVKAALAEAAAEGVTDADVIAEAPHAFSGRLEWIAEDNEQTMRGGGVITHRSGWYYTTGQYWPTEYRKAAASVLEAATSKVRQSRPPAKRMPTTMAELRALAKENGSHWFDASSMRFFGTRIESKVIRGRYFVTSEQPPHGPRKFSLRSFDEVGAIDTVGEFCAHNSKRQAIAAIPESTA
jgi:hypothetical protein